MKAAMSCSPIVGFLLFLVHVVVGDHGEAFQGVVVGNPNAASLCKTFPPGQSPGLDLLRGPCGFANDELYPTLGYPDVALRDLNSLGSGLDKQQQDLTTRYGIQCGGAAFRYLCSQAIPRCDTSGTSIVWNSTIVQAQCDDMNRTCSALQFTQLQEMRMCVPRFTISGTFRLDRCRTPDANLLAPQCTSRVQSITVPTYYNELYTKFDQQFLQGPLGSIALLVNANMSDSCVNEYLDVACLPGFACQNGKFRDLRDRNSCVAAKSCLDAAMAPVFLPVDNCSILAWHSSSSGASYVKLSLLHSVLLASVTFSVRNRFV